MSPTSPSANQFRDVVYAFLGDVRESSRALRLLRALTEMGVGVDVLTTGPALDSDELADGLVPGPRFNAHVLDLPEARGPSYFWKYHGLAGEVAAGIPARVFIAGDLFTLPLMKRAAHTQDGRLVYDSRELYPHLDSFVGRPFVRRFWSAVERRYIKYADHVFTVNDSIAARMAIAYGIAEPDVLHNVAPRREILRTDTLRNELGISPDTRIALYQGGIRTGRGLPSLVNAARSISEAAFVIVGSGVLSDSLRTSAHGLSNVYFIPHISPDKLLRYTASADLGVHLLEPTCLNHELALPNKIFEYLMVGLPVVASDLPEIRSVVADHDVGITVDPEDTLAVVTAIRRALFDDEDRTRFQANIPRVFEHYNWEHSKARFQSVISKLI